MPKRSLVAGLAVLVGVLAAGSQAPPPRPYYSQPAISPDGAEIAFVSGGDIWTVPAGGGQARLLVSGPATESRPLYSPDGRMLAFISARTGNGDIYVLTLSSGQLKRLTFDDAFDRLDAWAPDSRSVYFSTSSHDLSYMNDVYQVGIEGGTPMPVTAEPYVNEYFSAPSPDGRTLAFTARGIVSSQWWRKGHSHLDESEIWMLDLAQPQGHRYWRVAGGDEKDLWPQWSRDGLQVFYVSDRDGAQNIWASPAAPKPENVLVRELTHFTDGRVLWPNISADSRTLVFERNFGVWKLDIASGRAAKVLIERRGAPTGPAVQHLTLTDHLEGLALSPDGKKLAFIAHGEIFAVSAKDGGEAFRVTHTPAREWQPTWSPDSRRLAYVSERDGQAHVYLYDFTSNMEERLSSGGEDVSPRFSPDGKLLAFERDGKELRVLDLGTKQERLLATGYVDRLPIGTPPSYVWSPDSRWLAYLTAGRGDFENVQVVPAEGGENRPVSFLSNVEASDVAWGPDGTYLLFGTRQRTEMGQAARIDLIPHTPKFREDEFRDLFHEQTPKSPPEPAARSSEAPASPGEDKPEKAEEKPKPGPAKPIKIDFAGIRERLNLLPIGLNVGPLSISPDGKWLLFGATAAGRENLYVYSLDELAKEPPVAKQLTSTPGPKEGAQFSADSKSVFYLDEGKIATVPIEGCAPKPLATTAEMDEDFAQEKLEVFHEAWTYLGDNFFDPHFHGLDWNAVRAEYEPLIEGSSTPDETRDLISLMLGDLNASHLGIGAPSAGGPGAQSTTGRLAVDFEPAEYAASGRLRIGHVVPLGPADVSGVHAGDLLTRVDGTPIKRESNLNELLDHKIGRRMALTLSTAGREREVVLKPVNEGTEKGLRYREWVEKNRAYVEKASGGRLGYVHMADMSSNALERFYLDLDAANYGRDGVVIDVRNNNGGFVNVYAIDVLARRGYIHMTQRDTPGGPMRTELGQRALEKPTILLTNRHSLSDAEDFTEGYRALHLGKVVGEPTAGWIIYTSGVGLIDGSILRLPETRITTTSGELMEMNPRPVDIPVPQAIGATLAGQHPQLDAAVEELLREIEPTQH
ncbi:MAG TPA: S41 family peptidase [Terriglobia bacterium]|nr:S41 family peptidase [Terriglobia bacterium]